MELIDLKEKEISKEGRGIATIVNEKYLQINQTCANSGDTLHNSRQTGN